MNTIPASRVYRLQWQSSDLPPDLYRRAVWNDDAHVWEARLVGAGMTYEASAAGLAPGQLRVVRDGKVLAYVMTLHLRLTNEALTRIVDHVLQALDVSMGAN